ncbi:MAG: prepilin peptidase [Planctomycetes bacterium]|nr:prepilin peptidase [Planctomycetota bacterium]
MGAPPLVFVLFAAAFGLLVGSFLNVCIFRLPRNCMSIVRPRSRCTKCLRLIAWYDNFPVFSYLALGGRCRGCGERISPRYPLVELLTGAVFTWAAYAQIHHGAGSGSDRAVLFAVQAYLSATLIVCTFIDLDFRILPDEITLSGIVLGLVCGGAFPLLHGRMLPGLPWNLHVRGLLASGLGAFVGGGTIYAVGVLGKLLFKKEAMGLGDVKLMAFLGAFLGWKSILLTLVLGCFVGAAYGIVQFFFTRKLRGVYVPFGPFLAAGAMTMIFLSPQVYGLLDGYMNLFRRAG